MDADDALVITSAHFDLPAVAFGSIARNGRVAFIATQMDVALSGASGTATLEHLAVRRKLVEIEGFHLFRRVGGNVLGGNDLQVETSASAVRSSDRRPATLAICRPSALWSKEMPDLTRKSWLRKRIESGLRRGFQHAYETVKVDPSRFLLQMQAAYGLPVTTFKGVFSVELTTLDDLALRVIRSGMKVAAAEGAGFGLGGLATIVPDLGILSAITLRTIQKLSLLYGFEFTTRRRNR